MEEIMSILISMFENPQWSVRQFALLAAASLALDSKHLNRAYTAVALSFEQTRSYCTMLSTKSAQCWNIRGGICEKRHLRLPMLLGSLVHLSFFWFLDVTA
jgi:hypothetical protein